MEEKITTNHELVIIDRSLLNLSGIKKVISFDSNEFILESVAGPVHISGTGLELLNLDTINGKIKIKGKINGYNYIEKKNRKEESFISKLFK